jgi:23S rRNA maturation mini-RNase III
MKITTLNHANTIGCHKCHKMVNSYIEENDRLICIKCWNNEIKLSKKNNTLKKTANNSIKHKKRDKDKMIYAINGVTSLVYSGFFK